MPWRIIGLQSVNNYYGMYLCSSAIPLVTLNGNFPFLILDCTISSQCELQNLCKSTTILFITGLFTKYPIVDNRCSNHFGSFWTSLRNHGLGKVAKTIFIVSEIGFLKCLRLGRLGLTFWSNDKMVFPNKFLCMVKIVFQDTATCIKINGPSQNPFR